VATPYLIGSNAVVPGVSTATETMTVAATVAAGDAIIVGVFINITSIVIDSVSDSQGNTYTECTGTYCGGTGFTSDMFVCASAATALVSGTDTITVHWHAVHLGEQMIAAVGYPGGVTALDQATQVFNAGSTTPSATTGATTQASELAVGWEVTGFSSSGRMAWDAGWTEQQGSINAASNPLGSIATQLLSSTGALTASGTLGSSLKWGISAATFTLPSSGTSPDAGLASASGVPGTPAGSVSLGMTIQGV
jgi:hypothetical protein